MWYQILIRLSGIICVSAGCCLAGKQMEDKLKRRKLFFQDTVHLIQYLKKEMLERKAAMNEALWEASRLFDSPWKESLKELSKEVENGSGNSFADLWERVLSNNLKEVYLNKEEWQLIFRASSALGGSDSSVQLLLMDNCVEQIKELERKAAAEYEAKGNLYRRLSVLTAVFIVLILI